MPACQIDCLNAGRKEPLKHEQKEGLPHVPLHCHAHNIVTALTMLYKVSASTTQKNRTQGVQLNKVASETGCGA